MNFRTKNNSVIKGLYIVLVLCIIAVMAVSVYSIIKRGNDDNAGKSTTDAALKANTGENDAEDMLRIFDTTQKTTQPASSTTARTTSPQTTVPAATTAPPPITSAPVIADGGQSADDADTEIGTEEPSPALLTEESAAEVISVPSIFVKPAAGEVSRYFNIDTPEYSFAMNDYRTHSGLDIECEVGTPVRAVSAGVVTGIFEDPLMGSTIVINHGKGLESVYMNLQPNMPQNIKEGFIVKGNEVIGGVGESSLIEAVETPHLHFEMYKDGVAVNPLDYISSDNLR